MLTRDPVPLDVAPTSECHCLSGYVTQHFRRSSASALANPPAFRIHLLGLASPWETGGFSREIRVWRKYLIQSTRRRGATISIIFLMKHYLITNITSEYVVNRVIYACLLSLRYVYRGRFRE